MANINKKTCHIAVVGAIASMCATGIQAQTTGDGGTEVQQLKRQVEMLMKRVDELSSRDHAAAPAVSAAPTTAADTDRFLQRKPGGGLTLLTRGGEVSIYGNIDLSLDDTTKGLGNAVTADGNRPFGRTGWMPAISSNLSYVGVRGFQTLGTLPFNFVYQFETQIDVSATSGTAETNSNKGNSVKGGLTSRNTFVGLMSPSFGAVKIGKTDAPYKVSTARMNPFNGMLGDYSVIMGNTGGDNRVEFGTRLDHAIWYESPKFAGFTANILASPGQNRAYDNSNLAAGESDCAGGNIPGSGGTPVACNDGSYGAAYSANLAYTNGPLYLTTAYEIHRGVNRTSDLAAFNPDGVANEHAFKVAGQFKFATHTTLSLIYEDMKRNVSSDLQFQNERSRAGYWVALSQDITPVDSVHFGWGHAKRANGDPGQHNTDPGAGVDNSADLYTLAWRHSVDKNLSTYANYAMTNNHQFAHYDLGAGGRGVTTDCHDASTTDGTGFDPSGGGPHCYAGGKLKGVSVGMKYTF